MIMYLCENAYMYVCACMYVCRHVQYICMYVDIHEPI